ncbi:PD-(D/E)XK nuclease family protein [Cobetia amphilecti]
MEGMEIRHSAILGWLLSPQETHGLGDIFLKAFLAQALRGHDSTMLPSALELSQADLMDAEIRREWKNIDILILSPRNKWVFLIENKYNSKQHGDQLKRYMDIVSTSLIDNKKYCNVRGIFLTLWEEEAKDARYSPIDYATICELIDQCVLSGKVSLSAEVEQFIRHYLEVIKEASGMSMQQVEMEKLARQLYRDHRKVLDFIVEYGKSTDFLLACEAVVGDSIVTGKKFDVDTYQFVINNVDSNRFSFLPKSWSEVFEDSATWWGCENWWAGVPLIMWLQLTRDTDGGSGQVRLYAEVGPLSNHDLRHKLIEEIKNIAKNKNLKRIRFQRGASDEGKKYSKFLKNNFSTVDDVQDHDQIANAVNKLLKSFQPEIGAVASILPNYINCSGNVAQ